MAKTRAFFGPYSWVHTTVVSLYPGWSPAPGVKQPADAGRSPGIGLPVVRGGLGLLGGPALLLVLLVFALEAFDADHVLGGVGVEFHDEQLREFGGPAGLRDAGLLGSALGRPQNKRSYGETELAKLAAAYAFGIARNHPFVDGNKRAALLWIVVFLGLNGLNFVADNAEAVVMIQGLAAGEIDEDGLGRWISDNLPAKV